VGGGFTGWIVNACASPIGIVLLSMADSTLFFSLPFGIDAAVIIAAARARQLAWAIPFLGAFGSTVGAALTFWMGAKIGEKGLDAHVSLRRLERIRNTLKTKGAIALAVLDLIPPPFPFTPFVLAAGALEVDKTLMFVTLVICRILRFGLEAYLATRYGERIVAWLDSDFFRHTVFVLIVAAVALSIFSIVKIVRATRNAPRHHAAA
jgi:membrane protein YqaA with SNARE-associated domain